MATWEDVRAVALALPETIERSGRDGLRDWRVKDKGFVWERPLRKADLVALGDAAPTGAILGARLPDVGAKAALIADDPDVYFTTPHFDGYPAILVQLDHIGPDELEELIVEAWLVQAPKTVAKAYLAARDLPDDPDH
ncbi:MAG TPA: MmcQ/YjbR family DNA-binding protein [Micromonosporaceae bacterium]|nr:MmcQ/YjbR family DNA-binding protein [Micromonosporaceae bacterium]